MVTVGATHRRLYWKESSQQGVTTIMAFPKGFKVPMDQGGPGQGHAVGGFGGNPQKNQDEHKTAVQSAGKAPVILLHGNAAAADSTEFNLLPLKTMLIKAGYPEELIWAPSYLGTGIIDNDLLNPTPHTNNVNEVREFIDNVREYLDVEVVDIIAHSLGCTIAYAIFRGLNKQATPVVFDQPKKWSEVGTFVALAGAFHGFGPTARGEWQPDGEFIKGLRAETDGGGGETPFAKGKPQTPPPDPHNVTFYCGIARGDFVDKQHQDTGKLAGAINEVFKLGGNLGGHVQIKESQTVFDKFSPLLNSVPPVRPVAIVIDKDSGSFDSPLKVALHVQPSDRSVNLEGQLDNGQTLTISPDGMWEVVFSADGADDIKRTFWLGVEPVEVDIVTDNTVPFEGTLDVMATTTRGKLFHALKDDDMWIEGPVVTLTSDAAPRFIAIDSDGIASEIASKAFKRAVIPQNCVTATAVEHLVHQRIDNLGFLAFGQQFGFTTPFTLCLVNGRWVPQLTDQ
jgi:pimeloyl-ACP methyl ester carboxylesterase